MVLVNWNTAWRTAVSWQGALLRERILAQEPEIICLTEAHLDFLPVGGHLIASAADYGYKPVVGRRKVILWSRQPWLRDISEGPPAMPPGRYVYGETETSIGRIGVHGVCIPWADAHVRTGQKNCRRWEDHQAYLAALPACLDRPGCARQVLVGDFNQRMPRKRVPLPVYEALHKALNGRFTIHTTGEIAPIGRQTVDHVATNAALDVEHVAGLSHLDENGRFLSDHFGITAVLAAA